MRHTLVSLISTFLCLKFDVDVFAFDNSLQRCLFPLVFVAREGQFTSDVFVYISHLLASISALMAQALF